MKSIEKFNSAAILFTDSYKAQVNGISVFTSFFIKDVLKPEFKQVWVYETSSSTLYDDCNGNNLLTITHVYVNANFSSADLFIRKTDLRNFLQSKGLFASASLNKIMISHGWPRIKPRCTYYNFYYATRNFSRAKDLGRLRFYDTVLFISDAVDKYRHEDRLYCERANINVAYYDFSDRFTKFFREQVFGNSVNSTKHVLVIANYQKVKNVWWLLRYNLRRRIGGKQMRPFCLLILPSKGMAFSLFQYFSSKLSVRIENDQSKKIELLQQSLYLFIPSFSEYNPVVALEAFACKKKVVSLYRITALNNHPDYHYLKD